MNATKLQLNQLSGKVVAIDAYNTLYQFLAIIRGESGEPLADNTGRVTSHLSGLFYRTLNLLQMGIKPVYVLDGEPPSLKSAELNRRRAVKQVAMAKYQEAIVAGRIVEAKKYAQSTSVLRDHMVDDTKQILDLMGVPFVQAPSEGEATAAQMTMSGMASYAASQDYDSLLFGAHRLLRNVTISGRRKLPGKSVYVTVEPEVLTLEIVLDKLGITGEQLVDLGILIGTDFNPGGFKGVGPATALKYIKSYGRLEEIQELKESLSSINFQAIREIFLKPRVATVEHLNWGSINEEGLVKFLCRERDFSEGRVRGSLNRLSQEKEKRSQSLEKWFG